MNVVFCFDDNYALGYLVTMISLFENNKDLKIKVYLITPGLNKENVLKFERLSEIYNQEIIFKTLDDSVFSGFPVSYHITRASYFRYAIPDLCPESKVLQLDGDTIVRKSLKELWDTDVSGVAMGVVEDRWSENITYQNRLGVDNPIFNNGVQLMNLDYWRENKISEKCIDFLSKNPDVCILMDQDANNIILQNKVLFLSYSYNFQTQWIENLYESYMHRNKLEQIMKISEDPAIVHFVTGKPWFVEVGNVFKDEFEQYARIHSFINYKPIRRISYSYRIINKLLVKPSQWLAKQFL